VTDSVLEDVIEWQNRPLEPMYPVVFFDALRVKIRDEGNGQKQSSCTWRWASKGMGPRMCWGSGSSRDEGAKFWLGGHERAQPPWAEGYPGGSDRRFNKAFLKRSVRVYPDCEIQTCIVHLIRNSLSFCNWKERKTSGH